MQAIQSLCRKLLKMSARNVHFMVVTLFLGLPTLPAWAVDTYTFDTPVQEERYIYLTKTLRCPKCQNQDIADSNAPIAADLRRELHRMLLEGKTNDEVIQFMVDRYGEFVVYLPRFDRSTWLLWLGPFGLVVIGVIIVVNLSRRRPSSAAGSSVGGSSTTGASESILSAEESEKLKRLLSEDDK